LILNRLDPLLCPVFWNSDVSIEVKNSMSNFMASIIDTQYFVGLSEYGMEMQFEKLIIYSFQE
jgi:hypothetical protein